MIPTNKSLIIMFVVMAFSAISLSGCTHRVANLTIASTKNIDLTKSKVNVKEGKRVRGDHCVYSPLGLIPLLPNLGMAVDDALEKGNGNFMVDQVTYVKGYYFVLFTMSCIEVEGTVLKVDSAMSSAIEMQQKPVQN